ncbi:Uma2 family endonuclease [Lacihabitans sp. LS3-19]|uniref:Uma2 family endonuclease n=1 Tax=Lacihabitans sp. LS3-19 TaxID=2487335 RepID=UPI0020CF1175|nr:Uma2 family endonuclease [Lacihabitans sp. LS3-19]MCP9766738.1 Uma2 family endonuclease [Lacihabitans sp. LS3-19]
MEITSLSQLDLNKKYSYADYFSWKIKERVELFMGKIFEMSPAPASTHQRISRNIGTALINYLDKTPCEVFYAPFDVRLEREKEDNQTFTVVQPDICVICDVKKVDERGCKGAPDLIVEILSPGNSTKEMKNKFELYEKAGVLEYWIVQPSDKTIFQYVLIDGQYVNHKPTTFEDTLYASCIDGFSLVLDKVFK